MNTMTREQARSSREGMGFGARARTENVHRMTKKKLAEGRVHLRLLEQDGIDVTRPETRGDCVGGARPCPWVSCKYNLYLDVTDIGSVTTNFPDVEPEDVPPEKSCALDVADQGGGTLKDIATTMNVTRERIRQIEAIGIADIQRRAKRRGAEALVLREYSQAADGDVTKPTNKVGAIGGSVFKPRDVVEAAEADEEDEPPTRISFFAEPDNERVDELVANAVWGMFARDSNGRGFDCRSSQQKAQSKRRAAETPPREEPEVTKDEFATAHQAYVKTHGGTPTAQELFETIGAEATSVENVRQGIKRAGLTLADARLVAQGKYSKTAPTVKRAKPVPAVPAPQAPPSRKASRDPVVASLIEKRDALRKKADALDVAIEALAEVL